MVRTEVERQKNKKLNRNRNSIWHPVMIVSNSTHNLIYIAVDVRHFRRILRIGCFFIRDQNNIIDSMQIDVHRRCNCHQRNGTINWTIVTLWQSVAKLQLFSFSCLFFPLPLRPISVTYNRTIVQLCAIEKRIKSSRIHQLQLFTEALASIDDHSMSRLWKKNSFKQL